MTRGSEDMTQVDPAYPLHKTVAFAALGGAGYGVAAGLLQGFALTSLLPVLVIFGIAGGLIGLAIGKLRQVIVRRHPDRNPQFVMFDYTRQWRVRAYISLAALAFLIIPAPFMDTPAPLSAYILLPIAVFVGITIAAFLLPPLFGYTKPDQDEV